MVSDKIKITNPSGLHLRPAGIFCKEAMRFRSQITFGAKGSTANAKSVLSVLGACVKPGGLCQMWRYHRAMLRRRGRGIGFGSYARSHRNRPGRVV